MNKTPVSCASTTAVILNFCGVADSLSCLRALMAMPDKPGRIIVVDNGSGDGSVQAMQNWFAAQGKPLSIFPLDAAGEEYYPSGPGQCLLPLSANKGYAAGNNAGIRLALSDPALQAVWILNNDTEPQPGALEALCQAVNDRSTAGLAGSTLVYAHAPERVQCAGGFRLNPWLGSTRPICGNQELRLVLEQKKPVSLRGPVYICGASLLVRREVFTVIGLLAEEYFLYYEDTEFSLRAHKKGYSLAWAPHSLVVHKEGGSSGAASGTKKRAFSRSELVDYLVLRNRIYLMRNFFPWALPLAIAAYAGVVRNRVRRGQAMRIPLVGKALWHGLTGRMGNPFAPKQAEQTKAEGQYYHRVLFLTARADFGGGPEHLLQLLKHLPPGIEAWVACPKDYPYYERFKNIIGKDKLFLLPHRRFSLTRLWRLQRWCGQQGITLLHSHGKGAGLYARLLVPLTGLACVHTFHGVHMGSYGPVWRHAYRLYERCTALLTQTGITVSAGEQKRILAEGLFPETKLRLIPNGVPLPPLGQKPGQTMNVKVGCKTVPWTFISVSRFDYQKNSIFLLHVLQVLRQWGRAEQFRFVLIGDGPGRNSLAEALRQCGLDTSVYFTGALPAPQVWFTEALGYFSSSRWEGMPLAALEAMAHGLPAVVSDVVGNKDVVTEGKTGFLYPEGDAVAAAKALCRLVDAPDLAAILGRQAREHVASAHDAGQMAALTWEVYGECRKNKK